MSLFDRFDRAMGRFYEGIGTVVGLTIGLFAVAISVDLILRLFSLGNLPGMQEIVEYALFAGVFLTAPWLVRLGAHIRVDLLLFALPPSVRLTTERVIDLLGVIICCAMIRYGAINLGNAWSFGSEQMKYFNVPEWWLLSVIVIAFSLLALEFALRFLRAGRQGSAAAPEKGV